MPLAQPISLIAPVALLAGYFLITTGKLTSLHYTYQWLNAIGAGALTYSVIKPFNVGVFITEAVWTAIALFGVVKIFILRRRGMPAPASNKAAA